MHLSPCWAELLGVGPLFTAGGLTHPGAASKTRSPFLFISDEAQQPRTQGEVPFAVTSRDAPNRESMGPAADSLGRKRDSPVSGARPSSLVCIHVCLCLGGSGGGLSPPRLSVFVFVSPWWSLLSRFQIIPTHLLTVLFWGATPTAYGGSQPRNRIGAVAAGLCHSHSNSGSELRLRPTPQLMATLDS